jgi:hypothetical protein
MFAATHMAWVGSVEVDAKGDGFRADSASGAFLSTRAGVDGRVATG